ncbi:hypothetical protein [Halobacteriovorax sp. YZS-1-2]|uniref:hypothetical protein n=1 Tax=Halobacteriovorax sp. YZS-1-2 TaxID=3391177 RepID=UPI00399BC062
MGSKFIALPVGAGDAFLLNKNNKVILFDGGKSSKLLPELLNSQMCETINIAVCSHNDSDHANGIIGLLKSSIACEEVWLPGKWTKRLNDLLDNPTLFYKELYKSCLEEASEASTLEEFEDICCDKDSCFEDTGDFDLDSVEVKDDSLEGSFEDYVRAKYRIVLKRMGTLSNQKLFLDAIEAAERIRKIAILAKKKQSRIRWFEFIGGQNKMPSGGNANLLVPLNSVELKRPKVNKMNLLKYISLTVSNRESLVFYSPETSGKNDGVLFTADSDLETVAFGEFHNKDTLITIPHHGSDANHKAYKHFVSEGNCYIRSDGRYKSRPGINYRALPQNKKFCIRCNYAEKGTTIIFDEVNSSWSCKNNHCYC